MRKDVFTSTSLVQKTNPLAVMSQQMPTLSFNAGARGLAGVDSQNRQAATDAAIKQSIEGLQNITAMKQAVQATALAASVPQKSAIGNVKADPSMMGGAAKYSLGTAIGAGLYAVNPALGAAFGAGMAVAEGISFMMSNPGQHAGTTHAAIDGTASTLGSLFSSKKGAKKEGGYADVLQSGSEVASSLTTVASSLAAPQINLVNKGSIFGDNGDQLQSAAERAVAKSSEREIALFLSTPTSQEDALRLQLETARRIQRESVLKENGDSLVGGVTDFKPSPAFAGRGPSFPAFGLG